MITTHATVGGNALIVRHAAVGVTLDYIYACYRRGLAPEFSGSSSREEGAL